MTGINYYVETLFLESELATTCTNSNTIRKSNMNYEKVQTKLDANFISIEKIESIINFEFQRACKEFSSLCESTYKTPDIIRELIEYIDFSFASKLLIPEYLFNSKLQSEPTSIELIKKPNDSIAKKNNRSQVVEINGILFNKAQLVNQVTSIDRTSLDRSRRRRFDKQPIRKISKSAIEFSQKLLETNEEKQSHLKLGDFFVQQIVEEDVAQTCIVEIIQIKKIVSKKKKRKELNREGDGWGVEDYNYSIKWEFAVDTIKGELSEYRFLLKTYQIIENRKIQDISTQFERVYEEIETFPQIVKIENGVILSEI